MNYKPVICFQADYESPACTINYKKLKAILMMRML